MDRLVSLQVFRTVAELRSFSAAADRMGLSAAMASKHVAALESRLGTRLLHRTSRHVSLSETGALYLEQVRQVLDGLQAAENAVGDSATHPRGALKLSAPVWMAIPGFSQTLLQYRDRYPDVQLNIDLSERQVHLVDEGFDLALRVTGGALDPGLVARRLMSIPFQLVGAPAYLDRMGRPGSPAELTGHALLADPAMAPQGELVLDGPMGADPVRIDPVLRSGNEALLRLSALNGMGLAFLPPCLYRDDVRSGRLETILPGAATVRRTLYAVYPSRKYISATVRTFLDFVAQHPPLKEALAD